MRALVLVALVASSCLPDPVESLGSVGAGAIGGSGAIGGGGGGGHPLVCGDGVISAGEQCDDGNQTNGDGCSSTCQIEIGFQCRHAPSVCLPANSLYYIDADDIHGIADGGAITTWDSNVPLTPFVVDAAHVPILEKKCINGHQCASFNGNAQGYLLGSSDGGLAFLPTTLIFDIFMVIRYDAMPSNGGNYIFSNLTSSADRGFWIYENTSSDTWVLIEKGGAVAHVSKQSANKTVQAEWHLLEIRGDGTNLHYSIDGGTEENTAFANATTTGLLTQGAAIGFNTPTNTIFTDMALALLVVYPSNLSAGAQTAFRNTVASIYGTMPVLPAVRIAFLGDSITYGSHVNVGFPTRVEQLINTKVPGSAASGNHGLNADITSNMATRYTSFIHGQNYNRLVIEGCVNDLAGAADTAGAQATAEAGCETNVNSIITSAVADGLTTIVVSDICPWASYAGSSTNRQNATTTFNAYVAALDGTQSGKVHAYGCNADLGTGSPRSLTAPNDSGDGLHPSQVGSDEQAVSIEAIFGL